MAMKLQLTLILFLTMTIGLASMPISYAGNLSTQEGSSDKNYPASPKSVVEAYCRSDFNGDGLGSDTVQKLWQFTTFEDGGGDTVTIISEFEVVATKRVSPNKASVIVRYKTLVKDFGVYDKPVIKNGVRTTVYKLEKQDGKWKITDPQLQPHISLARMIQHLEELSQQSAGESLGEEEQTLLKKLKSNRDLLKKYARNQKVIYSSR